ncbi:RDD family protein [Cyanobacterium stanieri LEGE 03274]|uniref:RDD family protein n=2 Tax=Cyanobacterium TaxID=102234 RepID=A0ABR9V2S4_9CHRO|nr:RDD family protein [Cyanobacterium stanieri]MBE9222182.1 RDD family protein [Cyanobacterium stanieri LEGE 03274]
MYQEESLIRRKPKAPPERRAYAFLVDFVLVWLISSLVTNVFAEFLVFVLLWLVLRVIVVDKNQGQSLGKWAFDLKVIDAELKRRPSLANLTKREIIISIIAFLAMIGLKINFRNFISLLLFLTPIMIDGFTALTDEDYNQAFHDRTSKTIIVQTKRGFSLDLRIKKWLKETQKAWDKNRKKVR